ncbi:MAG: glycosyltransferase [Limisphaerales bacterium]
MASPITVIVTAYQRVEQTLMTLRKLLNCQPSPDEILVHVDGNHEACAKAIRDAFPGVQVIVSEQNIGPGGARNKLIAAAKHEFVASFDDDSYPLDDDYFARVETLMAQFSEVSILNAAVYHQGETIRPDARRAEWAADFSGGACVYRRSAFLATTGYVPLPLAYGMEEVDFAVRLRAQGGRILQTTWLRVYHDTDRQRHSSPAVTSASIANMALLTYLRYPPLYWPVGLGQIFNRVRWLIPHGRRAGILSGIASIPRHCWRHRLFRKVVSLAAIRSYFQLRRQSVPVALV